jgi:hypothetical protein
MRVLGIIVIVIFLTSCKRASMSREEYITYMNNSEKLCVVKEFNGIQYKAKIQPPELLTLKNSDVEIKTNSDFKKELEYFKDKINFVFIIEDVDKNNTVVKSTVFNKERYAAILAYANTDLKKDLLLIQNGDTLYCSVFHLEPANSIQPVLRLSLGFSNLNAQNKDYTLIFNDNIFSNGPLKFRYAKGLFEQLPELKL